MYKVLHPNVSGGSKQRCVKPTRVIEHMDSLNQEVELHDVENIWNPAHTEKADESNHYEMQLLFKMVHGILKKLTPQLFSTLVGQVKQLEITTEGSLKDIIDVVFEKAIDEPNFNVPYANLCKQLAFSKVPNSGKEGQFVNIRKLLLTKCQKEFEKRSEKLKQEEKMKLIDECEEEEKRKKLMEKFENEERENRKRQIGSIRFIGELFKLGMITEPIMHQCIKALLNQGDEDSMECLCHLLKTIGKELDQCKKTHTDGIVLEVYFSDMRRIIQTKAISSRVRFMLQDIMNSRLVSPNTEAATDNLSHEENIAEDKMVKEEQNDLRHSDSQSESLVPDTQNCSISEDLALDDQPKYHVALKYIYKENQWSPLNPEGKKKYDREFLLNMQSQPMSMKKPLNLPNLKVIKNKAIIHRLPESGSRVQPVPTAASRACTGQFLYQYTRYNETCPVTEIENTQLGPGNKGSLSWGCGSSGYTKANPSEDIKSALLTNRSSVSSRELTRGHSNQLAFLLETPKGFSGTGGTEVKARELSTTNGKPVADNTLRGPDITNAEEMEKKTKPLIDEFIHNQDFEEAIRCVTELTSGACIHMFINAAINQVLERSSQSRSSLGLLFYNLLRKEVITMEQYNKGFKDVLELVDDYALDIPKIWDYLAEILEPVVEENVIPFASIKETLQPCIPSLTAGKLVCAVLHCAAKKRGTIKVGEMWRESGLKWQDFIDSDVESFLQSNKLEFTINEAQPVPQPEPLTFEEMKKKLSFYMQKSEGDNEEVFDWIESHIGLSGRTKSAFLRALVTSVFENAITGSGAKCQIDIQKVKTRMPVLQRYLDYNDHLELQALYALQSLMNKLDHPKGMLKQIFDVAYDDDLISEDAFKQWEESQDPAEQEGKGAAIHGVASFLLWLKEIEEESEVE